MVAGEFVDGVGVLETGTETGRGMSVGLELGNHVARGGRLFKLCAP